MKQHQDTEKQKLPLSSKLKLLRKYGLRDYHAAVKLYEMIFNDDYEEWKNQDWKAWLDTHRFNSNDPKAVAFYAHAPYMKIQDTRWKACKKLGMSKSTWKACMLKSTPDERPSCMSFKNSGYVYRKHLISLLPEDVLMHYFGDFDKVKDHMSLFARDAYTLAIKFDVEYAGIEIDECLFAVDMFEIYMNSLAHEYNKLITYHGTFFDYGLKLDAFKTFIDALKMSSAFDHMLESKKMHSILRVLCKWYRKRHTISAAYAVLTIDLNSQNHFNRAKSYKADEVYGEIMHAIEDVLRFKRDKTKKKEDAEKWHGTRKRSLLS